MLIKMWFFLFNFYFYLINLKLICLKNRKEVKILVSKGLRSSQVVYTIWVKLSYYE